MRLERTAWPLTGQPPCPYVDSWKPGLAWWPNPSGVGPLGLAWWPVGAQPKSQMAIGNTLAPHVDPLVEHGNEPPGLWARATVG